MITQHKGHCEDCRELFDAPYHSVVAWDADQVSVSAGDDSGVEYK